jgi:glycosyltransferase involved in cell wall biosynthesis
MTPILSLCIPTYNRPEWLERALTSARRALDDGRVELVISDNSTDTRSRDVVHRCLAAWPGGWQYVHNEPSLSMIENFNQTIERASGQFILMLSDDDYLVEGGVKAALGAIETYPEATVYLFGTRVVDANDNVLKQRMFSDYRQLTPRQATARLLSNSSFVRFPDVIAKREALLEAGLFEASALNTCDLDMWLKLFGRYGVLCVPRTVAAYTVHPGAHTMQMFTAEMLELLSGYFEPERYAGLFGEHHLERFKSLFFHQYILAGTYRSLCWHGWRAARETFGLFDSPPARELRPPLKWLPLRFACTLAFGPPRHTTERSLPA